MARWRRGGDRACSRFALYLLVGLGAIGAPVLSASAQAASAERPAVSDPYAAHVEDASQRFGIPAAWIRAVMRIESSGDKRAISSKGAMGLMQLMPETWAGLRARYGLGRDPFDPHDKFGWRGLLARNARPLRIAGLPRGVQCRSRPLRGLSRPTQAVAAPDGGLCHGPRPFCRGRRDRRACPLGGLRSVVMDTGAALHRAR